MRSVTALISPSGMPKTLATSRRAARPLNPTWLATIAARRAP